MYVAWKSIAALLGLFQLLAAPSLLAQWQPKRLWKIWVRTELDHTNEDRIFVVKAFQLVISDARTRQSLEAEIQARGGDERYLTWFEDQLFQLSTRDQRTDARVVRSANSLNVVLVTKTIDSQVFRKKGKDGKMEYVGSLSIEPPILPDPLLRALFEACPPHSYEQIAQDDSTEIQLALEGRKGEVALKFPISVNWTPMVHVRPEIETKDWVTKQANRVSYHRLILTKKSFSRCPLPPKTHKLLSTFKDWQPMGIGWDADQGPEHLPRSLAQEAAEKKERRLRADAPWVQDKMSRPENYLNTNLWKAISAKYPRAQSIALEEYLHSLSHHFAARPFRPHFYIADTSNHSFWSLGAGYFVIHAGLIQEVPDEFRFRFLISLELAHYFLNHIKTVPKSEQLPDAHDLEWALVIDKDTFSTGSAFSAAQEVEALLLVSRFFRANGWEFESTAQHFQDWLLKLNPEKSNLPGLHHELMAAIAEIKKKPQIAGGKKQEAPSELSASKFQSALEQIKQNPMQHYSWMGTHAPLANLYSQSLEFLKKAQWDKVHETALTALQQDPGLEPFRQLKSRATLELGKFQDCVDELNQPWSWLDQRRELLKIECLFFEGLYTEAEKLGDYLVKKYPLEDAALFWTALTKIRMRRPAEDVIAEMEAYWGDRPSVRALQIFYFGYGFKLRQAYAAADFESDIHYRPEEKQVFEFAKGWLKHQLPLNDKDPLDLSKSGWPLAGFASVSLPVEE